MIMTESDVMGLVARGAAAAKTDWKRENGHGC